jgi:hypothetical protein
MQFPSNIYVDWGDGNRTKGDFPFSHNSWTHMRRTYFPVLEITKQGHQLRQTSESIFIITSISILTKQDKLLLLLSQIHGDPQDID